MKSVKPIIFGLLCLLLAGNFALAQNDPTAASKENPFSVYIPHTQPSPALRPQDTPSFEMAQIPATAQMRRIRVLSPNGGEQWEKGKTYTVRWTSTGNIPEVRIVLKWGPGVGVWIPVADRVPNTGEYACTIPETVKQEGREFMVIVMTPDGLISDSSDSPFTIQAAKEVPKPAPMVTRGAPEVELFLVKPNLGNPLLLRPEQLASRFPLTVATRSTAVPSQVQLLHTLRNHRIQLYKDGRAFYNLRVANIAGSPKIYSQASGFPITAEDHKYKAGFRWEWDVEVEISTAFETPREWPQMFDIRFAEVGGGAEKTNYHAAYVDAKMTPDLDKFTLLHITDLHVAGRNDRIPEVLAEMRTPIERRQLLSRYRNFNDNLRAVIAYANEKARKGETVLVVLTGDVVDYYRDTIPTSIDPEVSKIRPDPTVNNFQIFRDIITGRDGRGEPLLCPIFVVPGNHDYLKPECPLHFSIQLLDLIKVREKDSHQAFGLTENEGREYDHWTRGCPPISERIAGELPQHWPVHRGIDARRVVKEKGLYGIALNQDEAYDLTDPQHEHLKEYLTEINYDTDFRFAVGPHQFVCLNTGQDIVPSKGELLSGELLATYYIPGQTKRDFVHGGVHNRGITDEHVDLLKRACADTKERSIVFCFTHAPLLNLPHNRTTDVHLLFEDHHKSVLPPPPANILSVFLNRMMTGSPMPETLDRPAEEYCGIRSWELKQAGYPQGGTSHFRGHGESRGWHAFGCAEGNFNQIFNTTTNEREFPNYTRRPVVVLSGHTHKVHEFRLSYLSGIRYHLDNYSGTSFETSQSLTKATNKANWLMAHSPLFLISGALKRAAPLFREIAVNGNLIESMKMVTLLGFGHLPPLGMEHLFTAESIQLARLGGYDVDARNSMKPSVHWQWAHGTNDRMIVMWDVMDKFYLQFERISIYENLFKSEAIPFPVRRAVEPDCKKIEATLLRSAGFGTGDNQAIYPEWYDPGHKNSLRALFYTVSAVRLNQFGVDFGYPARNSLDLQSHYRWALTASIKDIADEIDNRIERIFKSTAPGPNKADVLRLWFASESIHLARAGRFNHEWRDSLDPSLHLRWALSVSPEQVVTDILEKYQIQADNQYKASGLDGLRKFYAATARRIDSWARDPFETDFEVRDPDYYLTQAQTMEAQDLFNALRVKVRRLGVGLKRFGQ